jgi:hypothetical protein
MIHFSFPLAALAGLFVKNAAWDWQLDIYRQ